MDLNPPRRDWFFPIEEAPVLVSVTHNGVARDVRVPHKKALIAADTGDIVGIVGADMVSHHEIIPALLHSGVVLTAYDLKLLIHSVPDVKFSRTCTGTLTWRNGGSDIAHGHPYIA